MKYELIPHPSGNAIRPSPTTANNRVGTLAYNQRAQGNELAGDGINSKWLRVLTIDGNPVTRESWVAVIHNGVTVSTLREIVPPPNEGDPTTVDVNVKVTGAEVGAVSVNDIPYVKA